MYGWQKYHNYPLWNFLPSINNNMNGVRTIVLYCSYVVVFVVYLNMEKYNLGSNTI